jgi:hypothetical protein
MEESFVLHPMNEEIPMAGIASLTRGLTLAARGRFGRGLRPDERTAHRRRAARGLSLERLEERTVLTPMTLTVTSLLDSGPGTLWNQIQTADNDHANSYIISFSPGLTGTITLEGELDLLNLNGITINGPGASSLTVERDTHNSSFNTSIFVVG